MSKTYSLALTEPEVEAVYTAKYLNGYAARVHGLRQKASDLIDEIERGYPSPGYADWIARNGGAPVVEEEQTYTLLLTADEVEAVYSARFLDGYARHVDGLRAKVTGLLNEVEVLRPALAVADWNARYGK
jgi:hypothetical protein